MLNKTFTLLALILLSIIFLATCDITPPPKNKKKAVFIFCDVTGSLIKEESEQVAKLTADILDRLEPEAVFKLLPIHMKTDAAEAIMETNNTIQSGGKVPDYLKTDRRNKISEQITTLYQTVNAPEQKPERTCLLSGLDRAREFFVNLKNDEYDYELVFISDMIEHCQNTPAGKGVVVSIKDQKPEDALNSISKATFPDLSNARITVIVPGKDETISKGTIKPNKQTLFAFWSKVFDKCKNKVTMDDWFTAKEPDRIFEPQQTKQVSASRETISQN